MTHPISCAVLDMAGTTVADDGLVVQAFAAAADGRRPPRGRPSADARPPYVRDTMGESKIAVFRALFGDEDRAQRANPAFEAAYDRLVDEGNAARSPGAAESITALRDAGIKVALTTGFTRATQDSCSPPSAGRPSPTSPSPRPRPAAVAPTRTWSSPRCCAAASTP